MADFDPVQWVYSAQNNHELQERYDVWAKSYDQDLQKLGRYDREPIIDLTAKYVPTAAKILDVGAGTGVVGQCLHQLGYSHLVGIDLSAEMLAIAQQRKIYAALHQMTLGLTLDFPSNEFDAVTACGVFTYGHAPSCSFDELIRITKPGGYLLFTLRPDFYEKSDFKDKMSHLERMNLWQLAELGETYLAEPNSETEVELRTWVYQVL